VKLVIAASALRLIFACLIVCSAANVNTINDIKIVFSNNVASGDF
jgi:hypothetical protein